MIGIFIFQNFYFIFEISIFILVFLSFVFDGFNFNSEFLSFFFEKLTLIIPLVIGLQLCCRFFNAYASKAKKMLRRKNRPL